MRRWNPILICAAFLMACLMALPAMAGPLLVTGGRSGEVYLSTNNGAAWKRINTGARAYLNGVVSDNHGDFVIVGSHGLVLRSSKNATHWKKIDSGVQDNLTAIAFDDRSERMIAVGAKGLILRSDDLGKSWINISIKSDAPFYGVATDREGHWVAVGTRGTIALSGDGAEHFELGESPNTQQLNDVIFAKGHFIAVGIGATVIASGDAGASWKSATIKERMPLESVAMNQNGVIVAVGWKGNLWRSSDGGERWTKLESEMSKRLFSVSAFGHKRFVASGAHGKILRSEDAGQSWTMNKKDAGRSDLEIIGARRLPNLALGSLHLDESCHVAGTLKSTGPATIPNSAWDSNLAVRVVKKKRSKGHPARLLLADLDPTKSLREPGSTLPFVFKTLVVKQGETKVFKLQLSAKPALAQSTREDDTVEGELHCGAPTE